MLMNRFAAVALLCIAITSLFTVAARAQSGRSAGETTRMKIIFDTDIGDDIDDAYALALLATSKKVQLLGVTTGWGQTRERAELAAKLLKTMGRGDVPVYAGRRGDAPIRAQYEWARGYTARNIKSEEAVAFLR